MPFVVSLYHRIKRQISRRDRPRTHQRSHIRPTERLRQTLLRIRRRLQSDRLGRLRSLIKCALYVYFTIEHALLSPPKYTSRFIVGFFLFCEDRNSNVMTASRACVILHAIGRTAFHSLYTTLAANRCKTSLLSLPQKQAEEDSLV